MEKQDKKPENSSFDQRVTRRDFIKTAGKAAGIAALGMNIASCSDDDDDPVSGGSPSSPASGGSSTVESKCYSASFDVVVIGTGMGGSAAGAISALNGLKTLILEAMQYYKPQ